MARVPADPAQISDIFIDESSQTAHRYLVLGGVVVRAQDRDGFEERLRAARQPELPAMELGWTKVSKAKLTAYQRFVDVFFENPDRIPKLHFHSIVVDTHRQRHRVFNDGSGEVGFNKEVYQLCIKFARLYGDRLFHVYPDARSTTSSPEELRLILNRGRRKTGDQRDWPFRRVHPQDSKRWQSLQLVDLLIGALAFRLNGYHLVEGASVSKIALSEHILKWGNVRDVMQDTAVSGRFTVWHRQLR